MDDLELVHKDNENRRVFITGGKVGGQMRYQVIEWVPQSVGFALKESKSLFTEEQLGKLLELLKRRDFLQVAAAPVA